jgi:hypothetical protein
MIMTTLRQSIKKIYDKKFECMMTMLRRHDMTWCRQDERSARNLMITFKKKFASDEMIDTQPQKKKKKKKKINACKKVLTQYETPQHTHKCAPQHTHMIHTTETCVAQHDDSQHSSPLTTLHDKC